MLIIAAVNTMAAVKSSLIDSNAVTPTRRKPQGTVND
jgi:hypothetical protein